MATHKSAEKRHKQSLVRRDRNRRALSTIRTSIKSALSAAKSGAGDTSAILSKAVSLIDSAGAKRLLHPNAAARTISRLQKRVNNISASK